MMATKAEIKTFDVEELCDFLSRSEIPEDAVEKFRSNRRDQFSSTWTKET